ncbi:hypothetical protein BSKO_01910 [Bryopsis sp. KO-2023]|nr:hypothetical protein BSKO_01910 [Bryopsis sp. KO-2023]
MRRVAASLTGRYFESLHRQRWASSDSGGWFQSLWRKKDTDPVEERVAPETESEQKEGGGNSWIPDWMKSKLPGILGGKKDFDELKNMDIDAYAKQLSRARGMSGLSGALGMDTRLQSAKLKRSEDIISLMNPVEKKDPVNAFRPVARRRIAKEVGCTPQEVDDCINSYMQMKFLGDVMVRRKEEGKSMPTNAEELRSILAESQTEMQAAVTPSEPSEPSGLEVPESSRGPKGNPCPLAGMTVNRSTICPLTRKKFKRCCGK